MNNVNKKNFLKLKQNEIVCDECNGDGRLLAKYRSIGISLSINGLIECHRCKGYGKLDWCRRLVLGIR